MANEKGQMNVMWEVLKFGIMFYVFLQIYDVVIDDLLYPYLGNFAYATATRLLISIIPLLLIVGLIKFVLSPQQGNATGGW